MSNKGAMSFPAGQTPWKGGIIVLVPAEFKFCSLQTNPPFTAL